MIGKLTDQNTKALPNGIDIQLEQVRQYQEEDTDGSNLDEEGDDLGHNLLDFFDSTDER